MDENVEKELSEMLDSVDSINDDFINDYFSKDELSYELPDKNETEDSEENDEKNIINLEEKSIEFKNESLDEMEDLKINPENQIFEIEEEVDNNIGDNKIDENLDENIEKEIISSDDINNEIEKSILDNNLNEDVNLEDDTFEDVEIENSKKDDKVKGLDIKEDDWTMPINEEQLKDNLEEQIIENLEKNEIEQTEMIEKEEKKDSTKKKVLPSKYKKLSSDELIDLLDNTDNGEDFFESIEGNDDK